MFERRRNAKDTEIEAALLRCRVSIDKFDATGELGHLDDAVAYGEQAVALCSDDAPQLVRALLMIADAWALRFEATGAQADLKACADAYTVPAKLVVSGRAIALADMTAAALSNAATYVLQFGVMTDSQYWIEESARAAMALNDFAASSGRHELYPAVVEVLGTAQQLLPSDHPIQTMIAAILGFARLAWIRDTGDLSRIDDAEEGMERAVRLCPPDNSNRTPLLMLMSEARLLRYQRDGTLDALDACVQATRDSLDTQPAGVPDWMILVYNLGLLYKDRYLITDDEQDLDSAAHLLRLASASAPDPEWRARAEQAIAEVTALRTPPPPVGVPPDAVFVAGPGSRPSRPAALVGDDLTELASYAALLGHLLMEYEHTRDPSLLDRVCSEGRTLLGGLPAGFPDRWIVGTVLGPALMRRYEAYGNAADLDDAIELLTEALDRPVVGPDHRGQDLANLAAALINRFQRDRSGADLDQAIAHCRRAVESTPDNRPERWGFLNTLGTALVYRFRHAGRRLDLDESIEVGTAVLAAASTAGAVEHARANLGNRLRERFLTSHDPADIEMSVAHLRASTATSTDPFRRVNLALALHTRGAGRGSRDDLIEARALFRAVLDTTSESSSIHATARSGLNGVLADLGDVGEGSPN